MTEESESTRALRDGLEWPTRAPWYAATTWGPYYEALNPPRRVHFIVNWKVVPKRMDHAAKLWQQRQELRRVGNVLESHNEFSPPAKPTMWS
jgi:hypothetical protein